MSRYKNPTAGAGGCQVPQQPPTQTTAPPCHRERKINPCCDKRSIICISNNTLSLCASQVTWSGTANVESFCKCAWSLQCALCQQMLLYAHRFRKVLQWVTALVLSADAHMRIASALSSAGLSTKGTIFSGVCPETVQTSFQTLYSSGYITLHCKTHMFHQQNSLMQY